MQSLPESELVLDTPRLRLTPYTPDDADIASRLWCDAQVMQYIAPALSPEAAAAMMPDAIRRGAGGRLGLWCVQERKTGQKLGECLLTPLPIDTDMTEWHRLVPGAYPDGPVELGYALLPEAWGRGYATEICARLLAFTFAHTTLEEVVAVIDPDNTASARVLRKCGMQGQGLRRAYGTDRAEWLRMTRSDWLAQHRP